MTPPTAQPSEKLSLRTKIGFGLGDIYGGGSGVVISFYYLYFLTDVIRINPALAGTAFLISKLYDAVTDPFEGILTDRTRTPLGRRRPYLLAGIGLVFLSFLLMWYPVAFQSEGLRFLYVILTYLFLSTVVSIVMTAYNALASELTLDYHERTSVSSIRIFFSTFSSILRRSCRLKSSSWLPTRAPATSGWGFSSASSSPCPSWPHSSAPASGPNSSVRWSRSTCARPSSNHSACAHSSMSC